MQRLLTFAVAYALSGALAFAQGKVTEQPPTTTQPAPNSVIASPNTNGSVPSNMQGMASQTPSAPNQSLPGDTNPANAAAEGRANGRAVSPDRPRNGLPGSTADTTRDRNADAIPNGNPTAPRTSDQIARPGLNIAEPWLWAVLGAIGALVLIAILLRRSRTYPETHSGSRNVHTMSDQDRARRDQIRKVG
jgi:hypothetical protein